jgi:hypothetical protein
MRSFLKWVSSVGWRVNLVAASLALVTANTSCRAPSKTSPTSMPTTSPATQPSATATLREPIHINVGKVRPPLTDRIVSFHKGKADKRLIRLASELGFNGVQIQIEGSTVEGIKNFAKYDEKEHLVEYCHSLGMTVTLWVHELSDVPREWMPEWLGPVTSDNAAYWSLLDARYDWMLSQAVPNVDGLVLTVVETTVGATDTPVMAKLVKLLADKCSRYNKRLIVRTFVWYPEEFSTVMAAIDQMPAGQVIMSKCVPQDWNIRGIDAKEIGNVGGRRQIVEFDVAGEYFLKSSVPNCMPELLKRQFDYGVSRGMSGICVRVDRDDDSVLHEPNEVNLWALGMLAAGATDDVDEVWNAWATNRFGAAAAPGVVRALKPAGEVVSEMLSIGPFAYGDTRAFPALGDDDFLGQLRQNWRWDDRFAAEHERAETGEASFVDAASAAKSKAEAIAHTCLMDLELVKDRLRPEDYAILRTRLLTMNAQMRTRGPMALAVLHYRQWLNATTDAERARADDAMEADLARLRTAARPVYDPPTELKYLGRTWKVGPPENVWRDAIYSWAWKMDQLRRGEDPRPITPGHGLMKPPKPSRPSTNPASH